MNNQPSRKRRTILEQNMDEDYLMESDENGISKQLEDAVEEGKIEPTSFQCELAHGSKIVRVSGFSSIPELYFRIAQKFKINQSSIMYCTLNTNAIDMDRVLGNQLTINSTIYVHVRGQVKQIKFIKSDQTMGITLSDNKNGCVFIKRLSTSGSLYQTFENEKDIIMVGDMIECINGRSFINCKHSEVGDFLRNLPLDKTVKMRLISPKHGYFSQTAKERNQFGLIDFQKTIRVKKTNSNLVTAITEDQTYALKTILEKVEEYYGIKDNEIAQLIFDIACNSNDYDSFLLSLNEQLSPLQFPAPYCKKFWKAYEDYHSAIIAKGNRFKAN